MQNKQRSHHLTKLFFPCLLLVIIVLPFLQLFYPVPKLVVTPDFGRSDAWHLGIVLKYFYQQKILLGQLPFWTSKLNSGFPIIGEGQTGLFFVPNFVLYYIFDFVTAYNLNLIFSLWFISLGMFIWLRMLKYGHLPSFFGAITLTFSGLTIPRFTQSAVLQSLSFMPWVMASTLYHYRKTSLKSVLILAITCANQLLTGFTQAFVTTLIFSGVYYLWLLNPITLNFFEILKKMGTYLIVIVLIFGLSAIHIMPVYEFMQLNQVANGMSLQDATRYSFPIKHLLTFIRPFSLGNPRDGTYPPLEKFDQSIFWENSGYFGFISFLFGLSILFFKKKKSEKNFLFFLLIVQGGALLLMLGKNSPLYFVYLFWPLNQFRVPARFIWIFVMSLIVICAHGLDMCLRHFHTNRLVKIGLIALIFLNTVDLISSFYNYHLLGDAKSWLETPSSMKFLDKDDTLMTLFSADVYYEHYKEGWIDSKYHEFLKEAIAPNSNLYWNISTNGIIMGRFLRRPAYMDSLLLESFTATKSSDLISLNSTSDRLLNLLSIDKIFSTRPLESQQLDYIDKINFTPDTIYVYRNPYSLPRAYLTESFVKIDTLEEASEKLHSQDFIPGKTVLIEEQIDTPDDMSSQGEVLTIQDHDTDISLNVRNHPQASILVLTDTYYPGWEATIDGIKAQIYKANLRQRAVVVPEGDHEIVFKYRPQSFLYGAWLSGISWAVVLVFLSGSFVLRIRKLVKSV